MATSSLFLASLPYLICGSSLVVGRLSRILWKRIPVAKSHPYQTKLLSASLVLSTVAGYGYYNSHTSPCPITGKPKFVALSTEQMKQISDLVMQYGFSPMIREKEPEDSVINQQVGCLLEKLVLTNKELPNIASRDWNITIVNQPYLINAASLPTGAIFLFRGEIDLASLWSSDNLQDNSSLAFVVSHEMAHVVLDHSNQAWTRSTFILSCLWFPMAVTWASIPRLLVGFGFNFMMFTLLNVTCILPFLREKEIEADMLAIDIMQRGCFDITEAPKNFSKLIFIEGVDTKFGKIKECFSSHPSLETRRKLLMEKIYHMQGGLDGKLIIRT